MKAIVRYGQEFGGYTMKDVRSQHADQKILSLKSKQQLSAVQI